METVGVKLGREIRRLRSLNKLSQEELAFRAGISAAHLGQIERAAKNPTVETVASIAAALGVTMAELFSFDTDININEKSNTILNKIISQASSLDEENQKEMLRMMRIFRRVHKRGTAL
ncbi:MAG: helix-turn-helix transcriptional regulator [Clostridia bacterium]|nr:helix-turn-helix transcriptional regulator [Clostridia bacterium]